MGRDTPLQVLLRAEPEVRRRLQGGRRAAGDVRHRPRRQEGRRRRQGPRGAEALRRHPRRRGGHHQGAADRRTCRSSASPRAARTPSDAPVVTQYEMHGVEDARPAEDGLPRPAQPRRHHRHGRDGAGRPRTPTSTSTPSRSTTTPTLELLQRGDAHRRVPARGRADAGADAVAGADQLRRRRRARRAVPAGADGGQHAQRLRRPQERPQADRVPPPRPRGAPRRHVRPDDLPGVGDAGGPEVRRLLARRGRQPAQGVRQEDPRADRRRAGEVRRRAASAPATAPSSARSCSTSSSRSPTTPSTRATPSATGSSPTRPRTSRRTTRSSTSPAC